jgi:hypothetical protein
MGLIMAIRSTTGGSIRTPRALLSPGPSVDIRFVWSRAERCARWLGHARDWLEWFGWVLFLIAVVFLFVWIVYLVGGTRNLPPGQVRSAAGQAAVCLAPTTDL